MQDFQDSLNKVLDIFFHLPTLITIALITIVIVWAMYDVGFNFGNGFIRMHSNQGQVILYWINGCCDLDW